jgi:hypothetical protein
MMAIAGAPGSAGRHALARTFGVASETISLRPGDGFHYFDLEVPSEMPDSGRRIPGDLTFKFRDGASLVLPLQTICKTEEVKKQIATRKGCRWHEIDLFQNGRIVREDDDFGAQVVSTRPVFVNLLRERGSPADDWMTDLVTGLNELHSEEIRELMGQVSIDFAHALLVYRREDSDLDRTRQLLLGHREALVLFAEDLDSCRQGTAVA